MFTSSKNPSEFKQCLPQFTKIFLKLKNVNKFKILINLENVHESNNIHEFKKLKIQKNPMKLKNANLKKKIEKKKNKIEKKRKTGNKE